MELPDLLDSIVIAFLIAWFLRECGISWLQTVQVEEMIQTAKTQVSSLGDFQGIIHWRFTPRERNIYLVHS